MYFIKERKVSLGGIITGIWNNRVFLSINKLVEGGSGCDQSLSKVDSKELYRSDLSIHS